MTSIPEICANCEHLQCGVWCLVWSQPTEAGNTCHSWEVKEELLPILEDVQAICALFPVKKKV